MIFGGARAVALFLSIRRGAGGCGATIDHIELGTPDSSLSLRGCEEQLSSFLDANWTLK